MLTTKDIYLLYLDGIRSFETSVIEPELFNRIINDAQDVFVNENLPVGDLGQRQIDNLQVIILSRELTESRKNVFVLPTDYLRKNAIFASFQEIPSDVCDIEKGEWYGVNTLKGDAFSLSASNPYRKPSIRMRYAYITNNEVVFEVGNSKVSEAKMIYYRKPRQIFFDQDNQNDVSSAPAFGPALYTAGSGCVNSEFNDQQKRMIVQVAVRITLEARMNPRYKSFLNEETLRDRKN